MVSSFGMSVSLKTDLRFPIIGQQGHGSQNIQLRDRTENRIREVSEGGVVPDTRERDWESGGRIERQAGDVKWNGAEPETRRERDFSRLLSDAARQKHPLERQFDMWVERISERAVLTGRDRREKAGLLDRIRKLEEDSALDMESRLGWARQWIESYLESGVSVSEADRKEMEEQRLEYHALCEMLGMTPTKTLPEEILQENHRIMQVLEKRRQNQYVMETLTKIMEECGAHVKDEDILEGGAGQFFSVEGSPLCDVFVGSKGSSVLFIPVVNNAEALENAAERETVRQDAGILCGMYAQVEAKAAEAGIFLRRERFRPFVLEEVLSEGRVQEKTETREKRQVKNRRREMEA